jgi:hypothetical protein
MNQQDFRPQQTRNPAKDGNASTAGFFSGLLVDTVKGRSGSDPFVIALAASTNPTMTVVTEEYVGKVRIPDVCNAEKIEYCGFSSASPPINPANQTPNRMRHTRHIRLLCCFSNGH